MDQLKSQFVDVK